MAPDVDKAAPTAESAKGAGAPEITCPCCHHSWRVPLGDNRYPIERFFSAALASASSSSPSSRLAVLADIESGRLEIQIPKEILELGEEIVAGSDTLGIF